MTTTQIKTLAPASLAAAAVGTGGTFAAATYFWKATAVGQWGESGASAEASVAVVLNGSATLTIGAVPSGTYKIRIYRGTATNAENKLVAELPPGTTSYTDTGTAGVTATCPATPAWGALPKTGGVPTKAAVTVTGQPSGMTLTAYAGACGWSSVAGLTTAAARNRKYLNSAGLDLQEV